MFYKRFYFIYKNKRYIYKISIKVKIVLFLREKLFERWFRSFIFLV